MIVQYWHSEDQPPHVAGALASFAERNPDLEHAVFDEARADAFIAEHLSARELAAFRACDLPAMQADYFRYCAIFVLGGLYADADLKCVRKLRPLLDCGDSGILFGREGPLDPQTAALYGWPYDVGPYRAIGNGFFAIDRPRHPLLATALEVATANIESRIADGPRGVWLTAGPGIFTSIYLLDRLGSFDAFLEYADSTILQPTARLFCEVVGDPARLAATLDGVVIRSRREGHAWARPVRVPRPAPNMPVHWQRHKGTIFRSRGDASAAAP